MSPSTQEKTMGKKTNGKSRGRQTAGQHAPIKTSIRVVKINPNREIIFHPAEWSDWVRKQEKGLSLMLS